MRNFLLAFFFLFAGLVQAYEVKLDTFETVPGRKKRSIVRELVKHLPDSDIVIIHNRPDEIWRDDGDLEWKYQWTFNFYDVRFCSFLKGMQTVDSYRIGYIYDSEWGPTVRKLFYSERVPPAEDDPRFPPAYNPDILSSPLPRLVLLKRQKSVMRDRVRPGEDIHAELISLPESDFLRKHGIAEVFSNKVFRLMQSCVFHVDYPTPELPRTQVMDLNSHIASAKRPGNEENRVFTTENTRLIHLTPQEVSEIVFLAYFLDKNSGGYKAYLEASAREPDLLLPMEPKPVFKTELGRTLLEAFRKQSEERKAKKAGKDMPEKPAAEAAPEKPVAKVAPPPPVEPPKKKSAEQLALEEINKRKKRLGNGYRGDLLPYPESPALREWMEKFNLTAGYFQRREREDGINLQFDEDFPTNSLPYLLFTPKAGREPVPLVLYFGGTGEHGTDLVDQFGQPLIFETVTNPDFQRKRPCYLFAPMLPKGYAIGGRPERKSDLICDSLYAVIRSLQNPPVDTNRLYVTGLSYGGMVTHRLLWLYPGRFAAGVPAEYIVSPWNPPDEPPNFWFLVNEGSDEKIRIFRQEAAKAMTETVRSMGGDCRVSFYPDTGHDAWKKAWTEEAVWDWMFSKTVDGKPVSQTRRPAASDIAPAVFLENVVCSASVPGKDAAHGPEFAADGLDNTCYISARPVAKGDWWMAEFPEPVKGTLTIRSGTRSGEDLLKLGRVETSSDGKFWNRAGNFSGKTGTCQIRLTAPVRFLRVLPENRNPQALVLRDLALTP